MPLKHTETQSHLSGSDGDLTIKIQDFKAFAMVEMRMNPCYQTFIAAHAYEVALFRQLETVLKKPEREQLKKDLKLAEILINRTFSGKFKINYFLAAKETLESIEEDLRLLPQQYQMFVRNYERADLESTLTQNIERYEKLKKMQEITKQKLQEQRLKESLQEQFTKEKKDVQSGV